MYSKTNEPPWPDTLLIGGTDDINVLGYDLGEDEKGKLKIKFRRKMDTGDVNDYVIKREITNFIYSFNKDTYDLIGHSTNRGLF